MRTDKPNSKNLSEVSAIRDRPKNLLSVWFYHTLIIHSTKPFQPFHYSTFIRQTDWRKIIVPLVQGQRGEELSFLKFKCNICFPFDDRTMCWKRNLEWPQITVHSRPFVKSTIVTPRYITAEKKCGKGNKNCEPTRFQSFFHIQNSKPVQPLPPPHRQGIALACIYTALFRKGSDKGSTQKFAPNYDQTSSPGLLLISRRKASRNPKFMSENEKTILKLTSMFLAFE